MGAKGGEGITSVEAEGGEDVTLVVVEWGEGTAAAEGAGGAMVAASFKHGADARERIIFSTATMVGEASMCQRSEVKHCSTRLCWSSIGRCLHHEVNRTKRGCNLYYFYHLLRY